MIELIIRTQLEENIPKCLLDLIAEYINDEQNNPLYNSRYKPLHKPLHKPPRSPYRLAPEELDHRSVFSSVVDNTYYFFSDIKRAIICPHKQRKTVT